MRLSSRQFTTLRILIACGTTTAGAGGVLGGMAGGGGEIIVNPPGACISQADQVLATQLVSQYVQVFGPLSRSEPGASPPKLAFEPIGTGLWDDGFTINYVDLNPTTAALDWDCLQYTYDGHTGHDTMLRSFDEQQIGVPVFAAFDGMVVAVHDGEPDMNTAFQNVTANFIIIDHGLGRLGKYWHLKAGSVLVAPGQAVFAAQQIASVGSSGMSSGPHLHFEIRDDDVVFEPYKGDCRPGESGWAAQPQPVRATYLHDFGFTTQDLSTMPGWPYRWPSTGQIGLGDPALRVWFYGANLPAGSHWSVKFRRPDGVLLPGGQNQNFQNNFWRWFSWWWTYDVPEMHAVSGVWHVLVYINDVLMAEAPIQVGGPPASTFNVLPEPITVHFIPAGPYLGHPVAAAVTTSRTLDDLDYDVVRYEYVWKIDGEIVRQVTTAGHMDMLRRDLLKNGKVVSCAVTPMDEEGAGPTSLVAARIGEPPIPAIGTWGLVALLASLCIAGTLLVEKRLGWVSRPGSDASRRGSNRRFPGGSCSSRRGMSDPKGADHDGKFHGLLRERAPLRRVDAIARHWIGQRKAGRHTLPAPQEALIRGRACLRAIARPPRRPRSR